MCILVNKGDNPNFVEKKIRVTGNKKWKSRWGN